MIIITHLYIPPASINYFFHPCSAFPVVPVWLSRFPSTFDLSLVAAAARPMVVHNHGPPPGHALLECSLFAPPLPCPTPWGEYHCASFDPLPDHHPIPSPRHTSTDSVVARHHQHHHPHFPSSAPIYLSILPFLARGVSHSPTPKWVLTPLKGDRETSLPAQSSRPLPCWCAHWS